MIRLMWTLSWQECELVKNCIFSSFSGYFNLLVRLIQVITCLASKMVIFVMVYTNCYTSFVFPLPVEKWMEVSVYLGNYHEEGSFFSFSPTFTFSESVSDTDSVC